MAVKPAIKAVPKVFTTEVSVTPPRAINIFLIAEGNPIPSKFFWISQRIFRSSFANLSCGVARIFTMQMPPARHCANSVAIAAPAMPQSSTKTATMSSTIFTTDATATATSGVRLLPTARNTAEQKL